MAVPPFSSLTCSLPRLSNSRANVIFPFLRFHCWSSTTQTRANRTQEEVWVVSLLLFRISTIAPESMDFHLQNFSSIETSILLYQIFLPTNTDISTCFQIPFVTIAYFKKRSIWIPLCKLQPNFCLPYCRLLLLHCLQLSMCILGVVQFSYMHAPTIILSEPER